MENVIEILKYLGTGTLLGVILGWFLKRKEEKDKLKYSEKCKLKKVIYLLLEIRNQILIIRKKELLIDTFYKKIKSISNENNIESDKTNLKEYFSKLIECYNGENLNKNIVEQFSKSIYEISEINPVLAYKLNGKQNLSEYIERWENLSSNPSEWESIEVMEETINTIKPQLIDDMLIDIDNTLINMANTIKEKKINNDLKDIFNLEPYNLEHEIKEKIEQFFKDFNLIKN